MASPSMITNIGRASLGLLRGLVDSVRGFDKRTPEHRATALESRAAGLVAVAEQLRKDAAAMRANPVQTPATRRTWMRMARRSTRIARRAARLKARADGIRAGAK